MTKEEMKSVTLDLEGGKSVNLFDLVSEATVEQLKESGVIGDDGRVKFASLPSEVKDAATLQIEKLEAGANWVKAQALPESKHGEFGVKAVDSTAGSFGAVVPETVASKILEKKTERAKIRSRAFVYQMAGTFNLPVENVAITGYWVGDNATVTESSPTLAKKQFTDNYVAGRILLPWQLLNSTPVAIIDFLAAQLGRQLANAEETKFVNGDGDGEPLGVRDASNSITAVAQVGAGLAITDIEALFYALPEQYRDGASFLMNSAAKKLIKGFKDTTNRPLFDVMKDITSILEKPVDESSNIPANLGTGSDETEILFGDFSFYHVKEGTRLELASAPVVSKLQTEMVAYQSVDGGVTLADAFRKLTGVK